MPAASPVIVPRDRAGVAMLIGELRELAALQRKVGNHRAELLTSTAIETLKAQEELLDAQGALIDRLAATTPQARWRGSFRRHGRKVRR